MCGGHNLNPAPCIDVPRPLPLDMRCLSAQSTGFSLRAGPLDQLHGQIIQGLTKGPAYAVGQAFPELYQRPMRLQYLLITNAI